MHGKEWVKIWRDDMLHGLELHQANYVTHAFARHMHDYYVLGLIEEGVQKYWHAGSRYVTTPGGMFVINPGEAHTGEAAIESGFMYRTLYPDVDLMQRVASELTGHLEGLPSFQAGVIYDPTMSRLVRDLHIALGQELTPLERESRFLSTFALLIGRYGREHLSERAPGREQGAARQVRRYLDEHYAEKTTLSELAHLVNFSPYYLLRIFEREIGISPHAYLESVRIKHAQDLLARGITQVQVAYELGFSSQSHFSYRFKRLLGVTPGEYVRLHRSS
ncbi:AraC family transcriptional regulator [Ktedonosporobacter rubrisoli]|uniref:AraC family transcriptional regulator n=1 Tax=Ktedonosporobacter rubrisoli TaxID=2509675 RepID=A0A4V0YYF8_KTERU|nr:AraC family transcriptional regulator [Ktedonosporobacter rubrisoli]QBD76071.1 AraC family transcriptional regulator [Ktedonosporobacter rubrisoli]